MLGGLYTTLFLDEKCQKYGLHVTLHTKHLHTCWSVRPDVFLIHQVQAAVVFAAPIK